MTEQEVKYILSRIAAAYPRFEITENIVEVWVEHLSEMPFEPVKRRLKNHIIEHAFPPSIAEIAVKPKPKNEFFEKIKKWEEEARASRRKSGC